MNHTDNLTEQRILDAAHAVFVRRGTAGARMQEIAEEAGVNKALLHYYFRSKERLGAAVFLRAARQLFPAVLQVLQSDLSIEAKVERVIAIELDVLARNPYLPGYVLSELSHHPERVRQLVESVTGQSADGVAPVLLKKLRTQINTAVRAGKLRPIAAEQFLANLLALCIFPFAARPMLQVVFGWDDPGFERFIEERKRSLPEFFLRALRP